MTRALRVLALGLLPAVALALAVSAGFLKWHTDFERRDQDSAIASVAAATEGSIALLSYTADTVESDLTAATDRLTGDFRDEYIKLIHDVIIPGSTQKKVSASVVVPWAASISASAREAVVLVFVDQTTTVGTDPPSTSSSSMSVTLEREGQRWLIARFDPV